MNADHEVDEPPKRLRALPVQIIVAEKAVILVRGVAEIRISGARAIEVVPQLLDAAAGKGATRDEIIERFAAPDREEVGKLVDELFKRSILVGGREEPPTSDVESSLEVFYWHFGQTVRATVDKLNGQSFVLMGVNTISRQIASALDSLGAARIQVVDFHILRNLRLYGDAGNLLPDEWVGPAPITYDAWVEGLDTEGIGCLVASSDFGGSHLLREWNEFCIENRVHFLPVILDRFIGSIGPLVIPGETPCYECLRVRENANMDAPELERAAESSAADRQAMTGFHPAMTKVLGELAAMELCKVYGGGLPSRSGRLIEVNLLGPDISSRRVLKLPRCPVCSPTLKSSGVYIERESFVPGHQLNFHEFR